MYRFLLAFMAAMYVAMLWPLIRNPIARRRWISLWRLWSIRHVPVAALTIVMVVAVGVALMSLHSAFAFSWISLIGGEGSLATGGISKNTASTDPSLFFISVFIFGAFLILIPHLAHIEERWFRRGGEGRAVRKQVLVALIFGLSHMVVGVPLAFGLALTVLGLVCTWHYQRAYARRSSRPDAVRAATSFHLTYNSIVGFIVLAGTLLVLSKPYLSAG